MTVSYIVEILSSMGLVLDVPDRRSNTQLTVKTKKSLIVFLFDAFMLLLLADCPN